MIAPHFSPCGAIVDYARIASEHDCQWYVNGPTGRIRFYFVPPTNKRFLEPTVFWSFPTNELQTENTDGVGPRTPHHKSDWRNGVNHFPTRDGSHICGDLEYFRGALPSPFGDYIPAADLCDCDFPGTFVFPLAGHIAIEGLPPLSPSISVLEAAAAELILSGQLATIQASSALTADAGRVALAGQQAIAGPVVRLDAGPGTLALDGVAPSLSSSSVVAPAEGGLRLAGQQADASGLDVVAPAAADLLLDGQDADLSAGSSITLAAAALVALDGQAAAAIGLAVNPPAGSLSLAGQVPTLSASSSVTPAAGALLLAGSATLSLGLTVSPTAGTVTLAGPAPTVRASSTAGPTAGALALSGLAPTLKVIVSPSAGALAFTGQQASVSATTPVTPGTTCAGAAAITLGTVYTFTINPGTTHWFKFTATSGTTYKIRFTQNTGGGGPTVNGSQGSCPSPIPILITIGGTGCGSAAATSNGTFLISVNNGFSSMNYSISALVGTCP